MQIQNKELRKIVCRELLKGGALSVGKLMEERAPPIDNLVIGGGQIIEKVLTKKFCLEEKGYRDGA